MRAEEITAYKCLQCNHIYEDFEDAQKCCTGTETQKEGCGDCQCSECANGSEE